VEARRSAANLTRQIYRGAAESAAESSGTAHTSAAVWIERGTCKSHAIIQQKPIAQNAPKTPYKRSALEVARLSAAPLDALLTHPHAPAHHATPARPTSGGDDLVRNAEKQKSEPLIFGARLSTKKTGGGEQKRNRKSFLTPCGEDAATGAMTIS
jgi:hypothetical protein